jgi:hypothetical protein
MCGLARTSINPPEFIMMGGDIAYHSGEFRPTQYLPLPLDIQPNPFVKPFAKPSPVCPGAIFEAIHPAHSTTEPYMHPEGPIHDDWEQAVKAVGHFSEFDAQESVFAVIAHDESLLEVVEFYPKKANERRRKGWKEQGRWRFLRDFDTKGKEKKGEA